MGLQLKRLEEQVMVVVGASSGIGLVTAKMAAARGARVVLAARNERDLERAAAEIRAAGGPAVDAPADVTNPDAVDAVASTAVREFGRIDAWVNCAAVAMYGRLVDLTPERGRTGNRGRILEH